MDNCNLALMLSYVLTWGCRKKSHTKSKKRRNEPGNFIFLIVASTAKHEHRDCTEAADKNISHSGVIVATYGGSDFVMQNGPRNCQDKWK